MLNMINLIILNIYSAESRQNHTKHDMFTRIWKIILNIFSDEILEHLKAILPCPTNFHKKTLAYYTTKKITVVKSFKIQALGFES
jgi:hypothetical protein